eukprot:scaffold43478_cov63-Phaeocystis_antarctica.AAC.8
MDSNVDELILLLFENAALYELNQAALSFRTDGYHLADHPVSVVIKHCHSHWCYSKHVPNDDFLDQAAAYHWGRDGGLPRVRLLTCHAHTGRVRCKVRLGQLGRAPWGVFVSWCRVTAKSQPWLITKRFSTPIQIDRVSGCEGPGHRGIA